MLPSGALRARSGGSATPGFPRPSGFGHPGLCLSSPSGCFRSGGDIVFPFFQLPGWQSVKSKYADTACQTPSSITTFCTLPFFVVSVIETSGQECTRDHGRPPPGLESGEVGATPVRVTALGWPPAGCLAVCRWRRYPLALCRCPAVARVVRREAKAVPES